MTRERPVLCIGETMALFVPADGRPLAQCRTLAVGHAGAESNVAAGLARLGTPVAWASRVGADPFGSRIVEDLRGRGVDVRGVTVDDTRPTGLLIKDPAPDGSRILYYRKGSAAAALGPDDVPRLLASRPARIHLSGVTSALSGSCRALVTTLLTAARDAGIRTSFDVNYRPALWTGPTEAADVLREAALLATEVLVGLDEAHALWGSDDAAAVHAVLPVPTVVVKDGARAATLIDEATGTVTVPALTVDVVEPVGAGDAFAAGWIHGRYAGWSAVQALRLGHLHAGVVLRSRDDLGRLDDAQALCRQALTGSPWATSRRQLRQPPAEPMTSTPRETDMTDAPPRPAVVRVDLSPQAGHQNWFDAHLGNHRVMVILRGLPPGRTVELARQAWDAGVDLVEVPVQGEESLRSLEAVAQACPDHWGSVGAGTVLAADDLARLREAGARFTVAPGFDPEVARASLELDLPHLPGVATAREVHLALAAGHRWQKLFPASVLSSAMIPALHGPFPGVRFVATGGIGPANAQEFLDAGAAAVSLGAAFTEVSPEQLRRLAG